MTTKKDTSKLAEERKIRFKELTEKLDEDFRVDKEWLWLEIKTEITYFNNNKYEPSQRGARIAAKIKNYKRIRMIHFIIRTALYDHIEEFDITPLSIRKLCLALFNKAGSQAFLVSLFGIAGRTAKASQRTNELIEIITENYKEDAEISLKTTIQEIDEIKERYKNSY